MKFKMFERTWELKKSVKGWVKVVAHKEGQCQMLDFPDSFTLNQIKEQMQFVHSVW